jgi:predicted acetyltransferase
MDVSIRTATRDDFTRIARVDEAAFGEEVTDAHLEYSLRVIDPSRFLVACDDERIVGVCGDFPFTMTVPGGAVPVPGVTWVGVDVTHRRRGVLTALMTEQLQRFRAEGYAAAVLLASEGEIYGRFGYGAATVARRWEIDRRRVRLTTPGDAGAVERVSADAARRRLPELLDRWRLTTPGALNRTDAWWDRLLDDPDWARDGMSPAFHLVHDGGYVSYRIKPDWRHDDPHHLCQIVDYVIVTAEAHRDLWHVLLGLDLVGTIASYRVPPDDPLPYLVNNPRLLRTTGLADGMWLRPVDPLKVLASRSYAVDVDVVIEVADPLFGDVRGHLVGGPDGATCATTRAEPDVRLDVAALGSLSLGGARVAPLAAAGRVHGEPAVLTRLDRALLSDRAPVHGTSF